MKSALETLNPTRVKMTVEVPYEELKPSVDAALKSLGRQVSVPGFRPGKVPARLIEQRVGRAAVLEEAVNQALPELYAKAVQEHDVRPLGRPEVEISQLPLEGEDHLVMQVEVDVRPPIELPDFASLTVSVDTVDDDAVEVATQERLTVLRQRFKTLTSADHPVESGNFVSIDLTARIGGTEIDAAKGVSYEVGSATMLDGLDEALLGMSPEQTTQFVAPLAAGEHEGEDAEVTVTVGSVKIAELPDLDDDFATLASEFDTMAELDADVREQARNAKKLEQGVQARDRLLDLLREQVTILLPEGVIEDEVHTHLESESRLEDDEHRAEVDTQARESLQSQLLLDAIAERFKVEVTQEELIEYLVMTSQQYGVDPGEFAKMMDKRDQVPAMVADVTRRKALSAALQQVTVVDGAGGQVDLTDLLGDSDESKDADAGQDTDGAADTDSSDGSSDSDGSGLADVASDSTEESSETSLESPNSPA